MIADNNLPRTVTVGIQWGYRIPCARAGCTRMHEVWASGQTPPVKYGTYTSDWFVWRRRSTSYNLHTWIAYCPEHAAPAREWVQRRGDWYFRKNAAFVEISGKSTSLFQSIKRLFSGGTYLQWLKDNPQPSAPWAEVE